MYVLQLNTRLFDSGQLTMPSTQDDMKPTLA